MFPISPDNQQPVSTVSRPSEDDISMQVDMDESAVTPHPLQSSQSTLSIPDDIFQGACHVLEFLINPSSSDAMNMTFIHYNVYAALEKDPDLSTRRADEREFGKNVERIGKQRVIDDFRDAAKKKAWGELMRHGTFPFPSTSIVLIKVCRQRYSSSLKLYGRRRGSLRRRSGVSHGPEDRG
jgi:hypothetical protein